MPGRIDIPISQFEQMIKDKEDANNTSYKLRKDCEALAGRVEKLERAFDELYNMSLYERTFGWRKLKEKVDQILAPTVGEIETV